MQNRSSGAVRVTPYDFRQAHSLSADQLRELQDHCQNLCRALHRHIPETTGLPARVSVDSLRPMTYNEYLDSLPEMPIMAVCPFAAHSAPLIWQVDASPIFACMDAMLGGDGSSNPPPERELTILERALVMQVVEDFVFTWTDTWPALATLAPHVLEIRQTTGRFGSGSLQEAVVAVNLECQVASVQGLMRVAVPSAVLRALLKQSGFNSAKTCPADLRRRAGASQVSRCTVQVTAVLGRAKTSLSTLTTLKPGDLIPLNCGPQDELELSVAGLPKFRGISGLSQGRLAVRVTAPIED